MADRGILFDEIRTKGVRTVREITDRILLSPCKGRGQGEGSKRDSYFSIGPKAVLAGLGNGAFSLVARVTNSSNDFGKRASRVAR